MSVSWTKEQGKVISLRNRNILVSAAAGSGKTAVLVERIISKITDPAHPLDIDRLLIMTFTRAAAGEMKERITEALEEALLKDPENTHLQRQMTLIHNAQITTIDGFCAYIIRNYFHMTDLDPGYRVAEEGELKLLREDVMGELLEDAYEEADPDFLNLVECYSSAKSDQKIREMILKLYDFSMSNPYPEEWLEECLVPYEAETAEEINQSAWMKIIWETTLEKMNQALMLIETGLSLCTESDGPSMYEETFLCDRRLWEDLKKQVEQRDYDGVRLLMENSEFQKLSGKKDDSVNKEKRSRSKDCRDEEKKIWTGLKNEFFSQSAEGILSLLKNCRVPLGMLIKLTLEFGDRFSQCKREKNIMDFADMEHYALRILAVKDEDGVHPGPAARELSHKYEEVLVDEYQDSNYVQEMITTLVSGWADNRRNIFMVGDVKQSIYRFRLARPELFMEKYHRYSLEDSAEQRIDLHKNFRSRKEVLASVNYIFRQIMGQDLGGITYDDKNALYPGAVFPKEEEPLNHKTEVILLEKKSEGSDDGDGSGTAQEREALAAAQRILRMVGSEKILDKKTGEYREVRFGDIAVLLRSASGWAEAFARVFDAKGIPAYTASRTGYFSAAEIVTVLNYLRICDNPCQDIPLASVLRSPLVGCTAKEMARVRTQFSGGKLYESICAFLDCEDTDETNSDHRAEEDKELKEKLKNFKFRLEDIRDRSAYTPVHELILYLLDVTGYGDYVKALPGGAQRSANLHMLVEKAGDYEKTSYRGLFNFVRYIEKLQKYEVDYGEANLADSGSGSVRIMTIHKSKGLEFPVVFVSGMGKEFNMTDIRVTPLFHPELGIGADAIFPDRRLRIPTPFRKAIGHQMQRESLGEELRVLYVALTRAKEKLIITGSCADLEKMVQKCAGYMYETDPVLPIGCRSNAKTFLDYLLPALSRHPAMTPLFEAYGVFERPDTIWPGENAEFEIRKADIDDLVGQEIVDQTEDMLRWDALQKFDPERVYDPQIRETLNERFGFVYPYEYLKDLPVKLSVSELKKRSYVSESDKEEALFYEPDIVPLIPKFIEGETEEYKGAARGTAYHRIMECLNYNKTDSIEEIRSQIDDLVRAEKLSIEEAQCTDVRDIAAFVKSPLGTRMKTAAVSGLLYREQPFVISRSMRAVDYNWKGEETVLIQGIIDAYFEENDGLVLVDYKTDRVYPGQEQKLIDLYHTQLEDYSEALTKLTKRKVKECYIYSFTLNKAIRL